MKVLELFAGSRSFTKAAQELGLQTFCTDINDFPGIDYVINFLDFSLDQLPYKPDIIWASPPCTTYSVSAISHHRPLDGEISEDAKLGDKLVKKTLEVIKELEPKYWFIENPRGLLRKQKFMIGIPRATVWYCQYGDNAAKPTDIWSNHIRNLFNLNGWQPRPVCHNNNMKCHHDKNPRGVWVNGVGTQGKNTNYEKSKVPHDLCLEILKACL